MTHPMRLASLGSAQGDPNFPNVTMLLHGDGTNGAQNNTFIDSSANNFTVTRTGNTTQGSSGPYGTTWSVQLPSTAGACLKFGTSTNLALGSGDFTVEMWVYINSLASSGYSILIDWRTNGNTPLNVPVLADYNNNGKLALVSGNGGFSGFTQVLESSSTMPLRSWFHVALVRSGTTVTLYFNGTSVATATSSVNFATETLNLTSPQTSGSYTPNAYFSNFRIVKGTAVYTGAFTPPASPLTAITNTQLLTCQSNRFIDNSSNNFTVTTGGSPSVQRFSPFSPQSPGYTTSVNGGSGYFDGSGDYISTPYSSLYNIGTGDFTLEAWVYPLVSSGITGLMGNHPSFTGGGVGAYVDGVNPVGQVFTNGTSAADSAGGPALTPFAWNHLAVVRSSGTLYVYTNGVRGAGVASSRNPNNTSAFFAGSYETTAYYTNGYLSDVRFVVGSAVYTANFTPPTAPLTAVTNTRVLFSFVNAGIFDNAMINDLETVGNAQISTSVKKYGTGSVAFDGSGDWLLAPSSQTNNYGAANLTWEMWVNTTNSTQYATLYAKTPSSFSTGMWSFMMNLASASSGDVGVYMADFSTSSPLLQTSGVSIRDGNWHHIAVVRNGSSWVLYVDGTSRATNTWSGSIANLTAVTLIGADQFYGRAFTGYIDDFRLTYGVARYTANFTPPTFAFPNF